MLSLFAPRAWIIIYYVPSIFDRIFSIWRFSLNYSSNNLRNCLVKLFTILKQQEILLNVCNFAFLRLSIFVRFRIFKLAKVIEDTFRFLEIYEIHILSNILVFCATLRALRTFVSKNNCQWRKKSTKSTNSLDGIFRISRAIRRVFGI